VNSDDSMLFETMVGDAGFSWQSLLFIAQSLSYLLAALGIAYAYKRFRDWQSKDLNDDDLMQVDGNQTFAFRRAAEYAALFLGMAGSRMAPRHGYFQDFGTFILDGFIVAAALVACIKITDWFVLKNVDNAAEVLDGNWAVAVVEACSLLTVGAILNGAFSGEGGGVLSALQFVAIGLLTTWITYLIMEGRTKGRRQIEVELKAGNLAKGIEVGAFMLGMGIIQRFSISGPFGGWWQDPLEYAITFVPAALLLLVAIGLIDWAYLRKVNLNDAKHHSKVAVSLKVLALTVGSAFIIGVTI
jgi:hypothetical protein